MNIQYINPDFSHSIESILLFQTGSETPYWSDSLFYFFPQLNREKFLLLDAAGKSRYLNDVLSAVYSGLKDELDAKAEACSAHWARHRRQVEDALSDAFSLDAGQRFNDLKGFLTLNPICPRSLEERSFDVFYRNSERGALGVTLHEMIHFLWFDVWHSLYHDDCRDYERPHIKWVLSEMVVESIMRDPRLSAINPYFPRENGGCVYGYFLDMTIGGKPVLETIDALYHAGGIRTFMQESYAFCLRHAQEIQAHIEKAEKAV